MSRFSNPLARIISNAAVGAGIGAVAGGYLGSKDDKTGMIKGTLLGAGVGAGIGAGSGAYNIAAAAPPKPGPSGWSKQTKSARKKYGLPSGRRLSFSDPNPYRPRWAIY
ncbi:MAG TPA: hypothetical protein VFD33_02945 [Bacillota bacterium]|nr:hypothetical protein [Bacillota bacterium]